MKKKNVKNKFSISSTSSAALREPVEINSIQFLLEKRDKIDIKIVFKFLI
jgi:hypothetical protein